MPSILYEIISDSDIVGSVAISEGYDIAQCYTCHIEKSMKISNIFICFISVFPFTERKELAIIQTKGCFMGKIDGEKKPGGRDVKYERTVYRALVTVSQFGINMLVPIFLCSFLGIFLDRKLGTSYWMVILFFLGALAGFRNVFLLAKKIYDNGEERTPYGGRSRKRKERK